MNVPALYLQNTPVQIPAQSNKCVREFLPLPLVTLIVAAIGQADVPLISIGHELPSSNPNPPST